MRNGIIILMMVVSLGVPLTDSALAQQGQGQEQGQEHGAGAEAGAGAGAQQGQQVVIQMTGGRLEFFSRLRQLRPMRDRTGRGQVLGLAAIHGPNIPLRTTLVVRVKLKDGRVFRQERRQVPHQGSKSFKVNVSFPGGDGLATIITYTIDQAGNELAHHQYAISVH